MANVAVAMYRLADTISILKVAMNDVMEMCSGAYVCVCACVCVIWDFNSASRPILW